MSGAERLHSAAIDNAEMSRFLQMEVDDNGIACLLMQNSQEGNPCSVAFTHCLTRGLDQLRLIKPKVLVLRGLPDVFSSGASRRELLELCEGNLDAGNILIPEMLLDIPFPIIAAMEGHAVGGGLMIGVCCDMVVMARESRYGANFMARGLPPGLGCTTLLAELFGPYLAAEMMFTGKNFRGSELALRSTNVNYIVKRSEVFSLAMDLASRLAEMDVLTLELLKKNLSERKKQLLAQARPNEQQMHELIFADPAARNLIMENLPT